MNKLLKGAIAGAAGVALLLGGAGSFALWNSSASVSGGTVVAGDLSVVPDESIGTWVRMAGETSVAINDISAYRIVPGDVLVYTKAMTVAVTGTSLVATLGLSGASIAPTSSANAADVALANILNANAVVTASGTGITAATDSVPATPTYAIATGSTLVTTTVTITFPSDTSAVDNPAKTGSVLLDDVAVTLQQTV